MDVIKKQIVQYLKKDDVQCECKKLLDEVVKYIGKKIWPYVLVACSLFVLILVMIVSIVYYMLTHLKN